MFLVLLLLLMWQHCSSVVGIQPKLAVTSVVDDDDVFLSFAFFRTIFSHRVAMANCEKRFFGRARSSGKMVQKRRCENCCKAEISGCVAEDFLKILTNLRLLVKPNNF